MRSTTARPAMLLGRRRPDCKVQLIPCPEQTSMPGVVEQVLPHDLLKRNYEEQSETWYRVNVKTFGAHHGQR